MVAGGIGKFARPGRLPVDTRADLRSCAGFRGETRIGEMALLEAMIVRCDSDTLTCHDR
jgi:hypothetical protein